MRIKIVEHSPKTITKTIKNRSLSKLKHYFLLLYQPSPPWREWGAGINKYKLNTLSNSLMMMNNKVCINMYVYL